MKNHFVVKIWEKVEKSIIIDISFDVKKTDILQNVTNWTAVAGRYRPMSIQ